MKQAIQEKIHLLQKLSKKESIKKTLENLGEEFLDKAYDIGYLHEVLKEIIAEYQINRVIFLFDEAAHTFIPSQQEIFFEIFKLLEKSVFELSISEKIATRLEKGFPKVGDVIHATRNEIMKIPYIKEVRSKIIKNVADEFISG
jgi:hypothetical protein